MFLFKKCCCKNGHIRPKYHIKPTNMVSFIDGTPLDSNFSFPKLDHTYVCSRCNARIEESSEIVGNKEFTCYVLNVMSDKIRQLYNKIDQQNQEIDRYKEDLRVANAANEELLLRSKGKKNV